MKSYIPYMGAKSTVADRLVELMPPEAKSCLIAPFFGGGSVEFTAPRGRVRIFNDIDADIVLMHQSVAANPEAVMAEMQRLPISRLLYEQIREMRGSQEWSGLSDTQRAARMIYLLCCAFNANPRSPFSASPTVPLNFDPDKDLRPHAEHLRGCTFECLHWSALLDRYVLQQKKLNAVVFADPPYVVATKVAHYGHRFGMIDHLLLAQKLALINERNGGSRNVKVMITYDDDPEGYIRSLYRQEFGWRIQPLPIRYGGGHHAIKTDELLITNFNTGEKA